jgi:formylglycine-generating enzyme required for sulfatase activity
MKTTSPIARALVALAALSLFILSNVFIQQAATPLLSQDQSRGLNVKTASNERRVALVIGNSAYAASPLPNPLNDARDVAAALKELGFETLLGENLKQDEMRRMIGEFGKRIRGGGVGLFYFAGHGAQVNGVNYRVPIGASITVEADVRLESIAADDVLAQMEEANNRVNIVILDACRDNPFRAFRRSQSRGLAVTNAPSGTLIAYATQPGNTAADGQGRNSPYTASLLRHLRTPSLKIEDFFKRVRVSVEDLTNRGQTPWESSSLRGDFYFAGENKSEPPAGVAANAGEQAHWKVIEDSADPRDFREFIALYPNGTYAGAARAKLRRLEARPSETTTSPNTNIAPPPKPTSTVAYAKVAGPPKPLVRFDFTTARVDERGKVTRLPGQSAMGFVEDLGDGVKLEMVEIAGGKFLMGSPASEVWRRDNEKQRVVTVSNFYISKYEVTQRQWKAVMGSLPPGMSDLSGDFKGDDLPVVQIWWDEAKEFISRLNEKHSLSDKDGYRLPSEAQWEYAARARTTTPFGFGATITPEVASYNWDYPYEQVPKSKYVNHPVAVGSFPANGFGVFDMHGNVSEWCEDDWHPSYDGAPMDGSAWVGISERASFRVIRGGSWNDFAVDCRSAYRGNYSPIYRVFKLGFRLVRIGG